MGRNRKHRNREAIESDSKPHRKFKRTAMSNTRLSNPVKAELVAEIVVDASVHGSAFAAEKHGLSIRAVQRYLQKYKQEVPEFVAQSVVDASQPVVTTETPLARMVAAKTAPVQASFEARLEETINRALQFLQEACEKGDPSDPAMVEAVADGMAKVFDMKVTLQVLSSGAPACLVR